MRMLTRALTFVLVPVVFLVGFATVAAASEPVVNEVDQDGTQLTIVGSGLSHTSQVLLGTSRSLSFKVVSGTKVEAVAPTLPVGRYEVSVTAPSGSLDTGITYNVYPPAPTITSMSRNAGSVNGGDTVVVTGDNLSNLRSISVGGPPVTYIAKSTNEVDIVTSAHATGAVKLSITTTGGTIQEPFTYVPNGTAVAVVNAVSPGHGFIGGNATVTITGSGFTGATKVAFSGKPAQSFTVVSDTTVTAVTPFTTIGGTSAVTVGNAISTGGTPWTYDYVRPWITSTLPASTVTNGSQITIIGSGFTGVNAITVDGQTAVVDSILDKQIVITAPGHAKGKAVLKVTNPAGTSNSATLRYAN